MSWLVMPGHIDADGDFILDGDGEEGRAVDLEVGTGGGNDAGDADLFADGDALEGDVSVVSGLAGELDVEIGKDGGGGCVGKVGADDDHGKLSAAGGLDHVEIAVAVAGVEGFDRDGDEEITLPGVADSFAFGGMADAIDLVHGVRHVIGESGLIENPLRVGWREGGSGGAAKGKQEQREQVPEFHRLSPEFEVNGPGDGHNGGAVSGGGDVSDGSVCGGDAVDLFAGVFLFVGHDAEDGGEDHAGAVDPLEIAVEADGTFGLDAGDFGSKGGEIGGGEVESGGQAAEGDMGIEVGGGWLGDGLTVFAFCLGLRPGDEGGEHGNGGDESEGLVDLEHVCALVEQSLLLGATLGLRGGEAEIAERKPILGFGGGGLAGRSVWRASVGLRRALRVLRLRRGGKAGVLVRSRRWAVDAAGVSRCRFVRCRGFGGCSRSERRGEQAKTEKCGKPGRMGHHDERDLRYAGAMFWQRARSAIPVDWGRL